MTDGFREATRLKGGGDPSPHRISLRLRLDFFDSPSRGE